MTSVPRELVQLGKAMTAEEFGMWALATFAWIFVAYSAVFLHAFVREYRQQYWLEHQLRLRFLHSVDAGDVDPFKD